LKGYAGKAGAAVKSGNPNAGNAVGYGDAGKAGTPIKSIFPNDGNAGGYGYAGKAPAEFLKFPLYNRKKTQETDCNGKLY